MGAQPGHGQNTRIDAQLHERHVEGDELFRLGKVHIDLLGDLPEFFLLVLLTHKGLHHPDAKQVFLYHIVQVIIPLEHPLKDGVGSGHNKEQAQAQDGDHHQEDQRQSGVDGKGEHPCTDKHDGTAHSDADDHHKGHLYVGHIGGQTGNDTAGGEFVDVGKGKFLNILIHLPAQIAGEAGGRPGGITAGQGAQQQSRQGHEDHNAAVVENTFHISRLNALGQQTACHHGNQDIKGHLADDKDRRQNRVLFELLNTAHKSAFFLHAHSSLGIDSLANC